MESNFLKNYTDTLNVHKLIEDAIMDMIISFNLPFYGEFALYLSFIKSEVIKTMGVNINENGSPNCYWNEKFVNKQTEKSIRFLIIHEIMHLLFDHIQRSMGYDHKISNLTQDMIINQIIYEDIKYNEKILLIDYLEMPKDKYNHNSGVFIPKEYTGELIFEELYFYIKDRYEKWKKENPDFAKNYYFALLRQLDETNNSEDNNEQNKDIEDEIYLNLSKRYGKHAKSISLHSKKEIIYPEMYELECFFEDFEISKGMTLDQHLPNDVSDDVKKQVVERIMNTLKNRGLISGRDESILHKLRKQEKDILKDIKRSLLNDIFGMIKFKSIIKPNRRNIEGLKGKIKYNNVINCILDTSGSMNGEFEKVLSYIFQNDIIINLIQCDTNVQKTELIKNKHELQKMIIKGLGGTLLTPALNFIANDKKLNKNNNVILTDGYTDVLDFTGIKGNTLIVTTDKISDYKNNLKSVKKYQIKNKQNKY